MSALHLTVRPDAVAVLTFDQPGSKANVLTAELLTEFEAVLDSLGTRTDLHGLVLASAKPGIFIAGADLNLLASAPAPNDPGVRAFIEHGLRVLEKLESLPFPTCAAIDGAALGGGLEVALACDLRIAGTNPKFQAGLPEVKLGIIPGWGGTQRLPRVLDMNAVHAAAKMLSTGESIPAHHAKADELVEQIVDSPTLIDQAAYSVLRVDRHERRARRQGSLKHEVKLEDVKFATEPTRAATEAVRVLLEGTRLPLQQGIAIETEAFMRLAGSEESRRLIGEFFASRKK